MCNSNKRRLPGVSELFSQRSPFLTRQPVGTHRTIRTRPQHRDRLVVPLDQPGSLSFKVAISPSIFLWCSVTFWSLFSRLTIVWECCLICSLYSTISSSNSCFCDFCSSWRALIVCCCSCIRPSIMIWGNRNGSCDLGTYNNMPWRARALSSVLPRGLCMCRPCCMLPGLLAWLTSCIPGLSSNVTSSEQPKTLPIPSPLVCFH